MSAVEILNREQIASLPLEEIEERLLRMRRHLVERCDGTVVDTFALLVVAFHLKTY